MGELGGENGDVGRVAWHMREHVLELQRAFTAIEKVRRPAYHPLLRPRSPSPLPPARAPSLA